MRELTHIIDSKLGQYGFHYDENSNSYQFVFDYWTDPKFGQYIMYYDIISLGALRYKFNFNVNPRFGAYTFLYSPLEKAYVEREVFATTSNNKAFLTDTGVQFVREKARDTGVAIDSFSSFLNRLSNNIISISQDNTNHANNISKKKNINTEEFISLLFYDSIAQKNITIKDEEFFANNKTVNNVKINPQNKKTSIESQNNLLLGNSEFGVLFEERTLSSEIGSEFHVSTIDVLAKIKSDSYLMESISRIVEMEQEYVIGQQTRDIELQESKLLRQKTRDIEVQKSKLLKRKIANIEIEKDRPLRERSRDTQIKQVLPELEHIFPNRVAKIMDVENTLFLKGFDRDIEMDSSGIKNLIRKHSDLFVDSNDLALSITEKEVVVKSEGLNIDKLSKDVLIDNLDTEIKKLPKRIRIEDSELQFDKKVKNIVIEELEVGVKKEEKKTFLEDGLILDKVETKIHIEDTEVELTQDEKADVKIEVEKRLDLHKRFWFLESLGEMDYKILPNTDYKYPPNIEIFKSTLPNKKYVYKYKDKFKDLGSYRVRLHKEDLTIVGQHDVIYIKDYDATINGIKIIMDVSEIPDRKHDYEVEFEIHTDTELDYMVINQPKGFIGNEFVFVATEEFMANNHPIPLGEDLGLREIPVSIAIMVDFMNILLLLWSKRLIAFSGMTGTQAIKGMSELVYEWLTLDTSLEAESIEDYFRCYRWFRWESEKVYNKAKQDPNLKGNRWIEEVIFEMIDYIDMHHFNKMPEWDMVLKMDEHRNIFNDPQYDIPIVLDKFKGVRKRVIEKNKRFN